MSQLGNTSSSPLQAGQHLAAEPAQFPRFRSREEPASSTAFPGSGGVCGDEQEHISKNPLLYLENTGEGCYKMRINFIIPLLQIGQ